MTTLKRTALVASLAAAGLLGAGGFAHADEADVSTIYGRASPGNPEIVARAGNRAGDSFVETRAADTTSMDTAASASASLHPVTEARATTNPESMTPPVAQSSGQGEYLSTPTTADAAPAAVITPTGQYLDTGDSGMPVRPEETVAIHEEPLDGKPLVEGRGVREGIDFHANTVQSVPAFEVQDVMGRSSPPAPEGASNYRLPS